MIAEVRGSDWRVKEYTAKTTRIIIGTYCAVFWRTARCEMRGPAVVSHGWSEWEARWLWPLHCCRPDSVSLELPVFASTPTTWPSTPSAPTTCYAGLMSAFWICSGSAPVTTWSMFSVFFGGFYLSLVVCCSVQSQPCSLVSIIPPLLLGPWRWLQADSLFPLCSAVISIYFLVWLLVSGDFKLSSLFGARGVLQLCPPLISSSLLALRQLSWRW